MQVIKQSKVIAQLPEVLEKNCLYYVRVGQGFDLYVTDSTGSIAYKQNTDDIITTMLNQLDKTGQTDVSSEFLKIVDFQKKNKIPLIQDIQAKFSVNQNFNLRDISVSLPNVEFVLTGQNNCITIGGNSNIAINPPQTFGKIMRSDFRMQDLNPRNRTNPTCKIIGAKGQNITIQQCDYLQLFCSTDVKDRSIAYCNFNFDVIIKLEITTDTNNPENLELWCNENNFYLKRCYALDMTGSYRHNCNLFIGGGFENQYGYINLQQAAKNRFLHTRLEGIGQITFGEQSEGNVIERAYYGSTNSLGIIPVTDNGVMNRISTLSLENSVKTRVFEINEQTPKWNTSVIFPNVLVSEYIKTNKTWSLIYNSPIFKMKGREDYLIADWDNTRARYLIVVEFFDEIGNKIDPTQINFNSPFLTYQANKQWLQGNQLGGQIYGNRNFMIMTPGEYNVRVGIYSNSKLEEQLSKRFTVDLYSNRPISVPKIEDTLSDIPTQFIGQVGSSASLLDGRRVSCTGVKSGEINSFDFNRAEKYITARNGNVGIKANAIIEIKNEDGSIVWTKVLKVAGTNSIVLENTERITNPISYKAFNLEYSELTSVSSYNDTLVKQQIDSIIAINRQQEERLDVIAKKQESSSDKPITIKTDNSILSLDTVIDEHNPKSVVLSLRSSDGDVQQKLVLSVINKHGVKILDKYELDTNSNIILSDVLEEVSSLDFTEKFKTQIFTGALRFKFYGLKSSNSIIQNVHSYFNDRNEIHFEEEVPSRQIIMSSRYPSMTSISYSRDEDISFVDAYIIKHHYLSSVNNKKFNIIVGYKNVYRYSDMWDYSTETVKPLYNISFEKDSIDSSSVIMNKRRLTISQQLLYDENLPLIFFEEGLSNLLISIQNKNDLTKTTVLPLKEYDDFKFTIPEDFGSEILVHLPLTPTTYKTLDFTIEESRSLKSIYDEVLIIDGKILLPSMQLSGYFDSIVYCVQRSKNTQELIKFISYSYWDSGDSFHIGQILGSEAFKKGAWRLNEKDDYYNGSSSPVYFRDGRVGSTSNNFLKYQLGTFWSNHKVNTSLFDENPNSEIVVYGFHSWFKENPNDKFNFKGVNYDIGYYWIYNIINTGNGEFNEDNSLGITRDFWDNAPICTKMIISKDSDGQIRCDSSMVSLNELITYLYQSKEIERTRRPSTHDFNDEE